MSQPWNLKFDCCDVPLSSSTQQRNHLHVHSQRLQDTFIMMSSSMPKSQATNKVLAELIQFIEPSMKHGVYGIIKKTPDDFDDIMQSVKMRFIMAMRKNPKSGSAYAFAYRISRTVAIESVYKFKKHNYNRSSEEANDAIESYSNCVNAENTMNELIDSKLVIQNGMTTIQACIESLSTTKLKTIAALRFIHGMTYEQISKKTGIKQSSLRSYVCVARREIKEELDINIDEITSLVHKHFND